ncbi:lovastatin nonaketide synthase [Apiospora phragmitis]|uniref:Lovastatin nonaketide synthase n=1 Tax=Apiospora phragmitis TaxID=2905665 RepID=A0ABR1TX98_9PEZI
MAGYPTAYFPFGGGANICPGRHLAKYEIFTTIATIVSRFEIEVLGWTNPADGSPSSRAAQSDLRYCGAGVMPPDRDLKIRWKRIHMGYIPAVLEFQTAIVQSPGPLEPTSSSLALAISHTALVPTLPTDDHVLIRVLAVAHNPTDYKTSHYFPTPGQGVGSDFCGIVVNCGASVEDQHHIAPGMRVSGAVFPYSAIRDYSHGAFSQWVVADGRLLVRVPEHWDDLQGAALGGGGVVSTDSASLSIDYGAAGTVAYTSPDCAQEVRKLADHPIRGAIDCITNAESVGICFAALARTGGRYACLEAVKISWRTRRLVRVKEVMGYEALGLSARLGPEPRNLLPTGVKPTIASTRPVEAKAMGPQQRFLMEAAYEALESAGIPLEALRGSDTGVYVGAMSNDFGEMLIRDISCVPVYTATGIAASLLSNRLSYFFDWHGPSITIDTACSSSLVAVHLAVQALRSGESTCSAYDPKELCSDPVFSGRIGIAACNSASSFTMSGDEDAIEELQVLLEDEKKYNKRLRVDRAYHSAHMLPCFQPYADLIRSCGLRAQESAPTCTWVSSTYGCPLDYNVELTDKYWAENMTRPVLYSQAVESALNIFEGNFDLVLEIGAHPALKGLTMQTIHTILQRDIPYSWMLSRATDAVQASSSGLGIAWAQLGNSRVDLDAYDHALSGAHSDDFRMVRGLPTYSWNHGSEYLHESRISRRFRARNAPAHGLLGDATSDNAAHHMSWRNFLRLSEPDWMSGHRVQGQVVFPAADYLATAIEAARAAVADQNLGTIRLLELRDFVIHQAVAFDSDKTAIEVLIQLADIIMLEEPGQQQQQQQQQQAGCCRVRGRFSYGAAMPSNPDELTLAASAEIEILLGTASVAFLPAGKVTLPHMVDVEADRFYQGDLDALLQVCILAYSYPYDERLRVPHLPTAIQCIRINPAIILESRDNQAGDMSFPADARVRQRTASRNGLCGHVSSHPGESSHGAIQIQGAEFQPVGAVREEADRKMFSKVHWINAGACFPYWSALPRVFRAETTMLQEFRAGGSVGILDRYYAEGFGLKESVLWISQAVKQITDRYPHMDIMEIGAGTGGATKAIFREVGQSFRSYTYTDISAAFFENASHIFPEQRDRMSFKTFDTEKPPQAQGFVEGAYDLVVAFFVIHATSDLARALRNVRRLLRPGGFLVVGKGQDGGDGVTGNGFIFGTLPGWWLGADRDGRVLSPLVSPDTWATLLSGTGFSAPDISVPVEWAHLLKAYHFVAQAVDDRSGSSGSP